MSYLLDAFEFFLMNAAPVQNEFTAQEKYLMERMNNPNTEITVRIAQKILNLSESSARRILVSLVGKEYSTVDLSQISHICHL